MKGQNPQIWGRLRLVLLYFKTTSSVLTSKKFHLTLHADIAGWGSTSDGGAKAYRHIPVNIVPPGNIDMASVSFWIETLFFDRNLIVFRLEMTLKL